MYSQRHSVINHCDRCITILSDIDISFGLFINLFTSVDMPFGWYKVTLNEKEILKISFIEHTIYPNHQDEWYVHHSDSSCYVSDCTVHVLWEIVGIFPLV